MDEAIAVKKEFDAAIKRDTIFQCVGGSPHGKGCGTYQRVGDSVFIQRHWYVRPSGCTDGDYYKQGDGEVVCDHCGIINRMYETPALQDLKYSFKEVIDKHDD